MSKPEASDFKPGDLVEDIRKPKSFNGLGTVIETKPKLRASRNEVPVRWDAWDTYLDREDSVDFHGTPPEGIRRVGPSDEEVKEAIESILRGSHA